MHGLTAKRKGGATGRRSIRGRRRGKARRAAAIGSLEDANDRMWLLALDFSLTVTYGLKSEQSKIVVFRLSTVIRVLEDKARNVQAVREGYMQ